MPPESEQRHSRKPPIISRDDVSDLFWWLLAGMGAAGAFISMRRFIFGLLAAAALFLIGLVFAIAKGLLARRRWRSGSE